MSNRTKGICAIIISALGFALMNLFIPLAGNLPTMQKMFFRNLIALLVALVVFFKDRTHATDQLGLPRTTQQWALLLLRALCGTLGVFCNFYAMDHLLLSDATVLNKLAPFATLIFSAFFLKEHFNRLHLFALVLSFLGVICIVRPTMTHFAWLPYVIAIMGGVAAGGAYTCVRQLAKSGIDPAFIVIFFSFFSCLACIPFMWHHFYPMSLSSIACLISVGLAATVGQFGITYAYKFAPASEISIFDYSQIIFAGILGYLVLHQTPDLFSLIGYLIIFAATLLTFMYNRHLAKTAVSSIKHPTP